MKNIISTKEAKGKIVSEIASDWCNFCLHFTDDSCIVFVAEHGYEGAISVNTPSINDIEDIDLLDLKIITEEEFEEKQKIIFVKDQERLHKRYIELKAYFKEEVKDDNNRCSKG